MKVAIGICGIGLGHCSRQVQIARRLDELGHDVRILTFGSGLEYFAQTEFYDRCHEVFVPWVDCDAGGVRWLKTLLMNWRDLPSGLRRNRRTFAELETLDFRPDVCVADYEPVTWRFARRHGAPVVTIDHQHAYLGFHLPSLSNGLSPREERSRLSLFFPEATLRIAISFFKIDAPKDLRYPVQLMPPMIRSDVAALATGSREIDEKLILIYLSAYPQIGSIVDHMALVDVLKHKHKWRFVVYAPTFGMRERVAENVELVPTTGQEFLGDLARASALICTAGFTLLSEAMFIGLPVLAIPLATYDQHLCASAIEDAGVGLAARSERDVSGELVDDFLSRLTEFRNAIASSDSLLREAPELVLEKICERIVSVGAVGRTGSI